MSQKIDVVAHLHAAPGHEALFREVLEGFVEPMRREKGCLRYDLFFDAENPSRAPVSPTISMASMGVIRSAGSRCQAPIARRKLALPGLVA